MSNRIAKNFGTILVGTALFASAPFTGYAYYNAYVSTDSVTNITPMNATFNGSINTGGIPGNAWFEYGTDTSFGYATTLNASNFNAPYSGNFSANISGLTANTTYYVRAIGQNSQGKVYGNVVSFTTNFSTSGYNNSMSPTAITTGGAVLAGNTAQFNALILTGNSDKADTWFEWGTSANLDNKTEVTPVNGAPAIRHTNTITGLAHSTTYYFRAVTENSYGKSEGAILSLVTGGSAQNNVKGTATKITSTDKVDSGKNINSNSGFSMLGANVFGLDSFFPVNLFGWLLLLILILVLVLLGKHAYGEFSQKKHH